MRNRLMWWSDTLERTARTFVVAAAGSFVVFGFDDWKAALASAAIAALGTVGLSTAATQVGAPSSAALLPATLDPPPREEAA